ncbi:glycosyltransferase family 2 protein [Thermodesulfobacteriota bacterium]
MNNEHDLTPQVSIIIPAHNEEESIESTVVELNGVLRKTSLKSEIIIIDDGSNDDTPTILQNLKMKFNHLDSIKLNKNMGQSAALGAGFERATGEFIVTMDADGQNDPEDIPRLLKEMNHCDVCCGIREKRHDPLTKKLSSKFANYVRNKVLRQDIVDTGCSLKVFKSGLIKDIRSWNGFHRFLPALSLIRGAVVKQIPVNHRPRLNGKSKYGNLNRFPAVLVDLFGVWWMKKRNVVLKQEGYLDNDNL